MTVFDRDTLLREIASFFADRDGDTRGEIVRRVDEKIYDETEFRKALAWTRRNA